MKNVIALLLLFVNGVVNAQQHEPNFYQLKKFGQFFYADKMDKHLLVFRMGRYIDKAGSGPSIISCDTLYLLSENFYKGKKYAVKERESKLFFYRLSKPGSEYEMSKVEDTKHVCKELNNAYYLEKFFAMCRKFDGNASAYYYSSHSGFAQWEKIVDKEMNYITFRKIADENIEKLADSVVNNQSLLFKQANYLLKNTETVSYNEFAALVTNLGVEHSRLNKYFDSIINKFALIKRDYVVRLYKEYPDLRSSILFAINNNKAFRKELEDSVKLKATY